MWARAAGASWQAEQAAVMGLFTSVVPWASQGDVWVQVATTAVQAVVVPLAGLVVQVHGVAAEQVVTAAVVVSTRCVKVTLTPWTVTGPATVMVQGLAAVQVHGAVGVQAVPPCVPLMPSGSV